MRSDTDRKPFWRWLDTGLRFALVLAAFFAYVLVRVDPALIYHRMVTRSYRSDWVIVDPSLINHRFSSLPLSMYDESVGWFLSHPGGPAAYLAAWLSEHYFIPWLGAMMITIVALLVCLATASLIKGLGGRHDHPAAFIPAVLLILLYNQFDNPMLFSLGALVAVSAAAAYVRLEAQGVVVRVVAFGLVSVAVYYLAGGAYLLFALVCASWELLRCRRRLVAAVYLALGLAVCLVGGTYLIRASEAGPVARMLSFLAAEDHSFRMFLPHRTLTTTPVALGLAVLCVMVVALAGRKKPKLGGSAGRRGRGDKAGRPSGLRSGRLKAAVGLALVVLVAGGLLSTLGHEFRGAFLRMSRHVENRRWEALLAEARSFPGGRYPPPTQHDVIQALYHSGRLLHEMFAYPLEVEGLTLREHRQEAMDTRMLSRTYFELGRVNDAEFMAQNSFETFDDRPTVLRLLAMISVVRGRTEGARMFLRTLCKYRQYRAEAKELLGRLDEDPLLASDRGIRWIRSVMLDEKFIGRRESLVEDRWLTLLERNGRNRMAFEYLMAYYLLNRQLPDMLEHLSRFDDFRYPAIPRHIEEAIALYGALTGKKVDLRQRRISDATRQRYKEFFETYAMCQKRYPNDEAAAAAVLAGRHGDSYFYYFLFGPGRTVR